MAIKSKVKPLNIMALLKIKQDLQINTKIGIKIQINKNIIVIIEYG